MCCRYQHLEQLFSLRVSDEILVFEIFTENCRYYYSEFCPYVCIYDIYDTIASWQSVYIR